jgi:putrescine importer
MSKLKRNLSSSHVVSMGLAWMSPMIFFTSFGVLYEGSRGMLFGAYLLSFIAIFFTAASYGQMAKAFPVSGSAYTYVSKALNPLFGFIIGWAVLLDYIFACIVSVLMFGINLNAQFPSIPYSFWVVSITIVVMIINIIGIQTTANTSKVFVLLQILFILVFCGLLIYISLNNGFTAGRNPLTNPQGIPLSTIMGGASLVVFSFLGFDSITTLADETKDPRKTIPRAIMVIVLVAGVLYFATSYLIQQVYPNLSFTNPDSAGFELMQMIGGSGLAAFYIFVIVFSILTQAMSSLTTASRLLLVMGQTSLLPKKTFGSVHSKFKTPIFNIVLASLISLTALFISLENAIRFLNFGALTAFLFVNISVVYHFIIRSKQYKLKDFVLRLIFPSIGALFVLYLITLLDSASFLLGSGWLIIGLVYYFIRKKKNQIEVTDLDSKENQELLRA